MRIISCFTRLLRRTLLPVCAFALAVAPAAARQTLTIEDALFTAMENSPDILGTRLDLERSSQLLRAQQAALKSQLSLTLNPINYSTDRQFNQLFSAWNNTDSKSTSGQFTIAQPILQTDGTLNLINRFNWQNSYSDYQGIRNKSYTNESYISYSQPLFTYNRRKLQTRELELDLETTRLSYAVQKLVIERQVTQNFYAAYERKMSLDIAREELSNRQTSFDIIKNKVDAGLAAREELYQAELDLTNSRSTVQNREMELENALDRFKHLIGLSLDEEIEVEADVTWQPVNVNLETAVNHGLGNRMELRQREIAIDNAQFNLTRVQAQNEFRGDLTLTYGIKGNDERLTDIYETPTRTKRVSLQFDIPLWDWGEKNARINASRAGITKARLSTEVERNIIIMGVREAWRALENQGSQIELAEQGVRNAELTWEINLERYRNGDLTSMDLNLFQNQLSQRKMALVQALIDYRLALLNIKIESLYDFEKGRSVLDQVLNEDAMY